MNYEVVKRLKIRPLELVEDDEGLLFRWLDTREIPWRKVYRETRDYHRVATAIKSMEIRGAPAIGIAAAYGMALAAYYSGASSNDVEAVMAELKKAYKVLSSTRPTAYNLFWALDRVMRRAREAASHGLDRLVGAVIEEAKLIHVEDVKQNMEMGRLGAKLLEDGDTVLTHCNAGALATGGYGTALGVVRAAVEEGKHIKVIATETRPLLQGARLTVWELVEEGIPVRLITDNMVGYVMYRGFVDKVVVGADRITRDGYVANKIGTYMVATMAYRHHIPFYVAAPSSTFDLSRSGDDIPIEERSPEEVRTVLGKISITLENVEVYNPAFDITPPSLVTAIITEKGVLTPPYREAIERVIGRA